MKRYRQMLVDEEAHARLNEAKAVLGAAAGRRFSAGEVIEELVGRKVRYLKLPAEVRRYINSFVSIAASDRHVVGILLFGSVAKGNFGKYSDIDVLVVTDSGYDDLDRIDAMVKAAESARKPLVEGGIFLNMMPLILPASELSRFRPIYIDFLEDGIVLFERDEALTGFLNDVRRSVDFERLVINNQTVIKWRMRG